MSGSVEQETGTHCIEVLFGAPVKLSNDHQHRLVSLMGEICDAYEAEHPDRTMWPAGIGDRPSGLWTDEPTFDSTVFQIECYERERFDDEKRGPKQWTFEKQTIADAIDKIGWPEIHRFQAELQRGQSYDEDAGGFMIRAIARLFGIRKRRDPVVTHQEAARALFSDILESSHD